MWCSFVLFVCCAVVGVFECGGRGCVSCDVDVRLYGMCWSGFVGCRSRRDWFRAACVSCGCRMFDVNVWVGFCMVLLQAGLVLRGACAGRVKGVEYSFLFVGFCMMQAYLIRGASFPSCGEEC